jgi:hypothetical protein
MFETQRTVKILNTRLTIVFASYLIRELCYSDF